MNVFLFAEIVGEILDLFGVVIILGGVIISTGYFLTGVLESKNKDTLYRSYRNNLGRSILLGLELMVAGDIIRSVTGQPNLLSVGVLALIVLIRSFLGITFEMEIDGRWPWQKKEKKE